MGSSDLVEGLGGGVWASAGSGPYCRTRVSRSSPVEQLHHVVQPAVLGGAEVVELHRVGRLERGGGAGFALEAPEQQLGIARHLRTDELDRRRPDQQPVPRPPDLAHPAATDLLLEDVLTELIGFGDLLAKSVGDP